MGDRLIGKVAIISGAARGMGAAEARLFAREGARVVMGDILDADGRRLEEELRQDLKTSAARYLHLDVTSEADWQSALDTAEREFGGLDILVNNAGTSGEPGIENVSREDWEHVIAVNQTGTWLGICTAVPALRRRGGGSIINISSIYGIVGASASGAYHASKGAVRSLSKAAALRYAPEGIRVNSVHPGLIDTLMLERLPPDVLAQRLALTPMGRQGTPEEIAAGVLFLASDDASFITGAELVIDGGYVAM